MRTLAAPDRRPSGRLAVPAGWAAAALLVLLSLALRSDGIGAPNLWVDEANSWEVARQAPGELLAHLQNSPAVPFHFLLLKLWMTVFGDSEAALRSLSLIASLGLLPVTYAVGRRLLPRRAALLATLLLALSPAHLYFAQEARMYMPLTLLAASCVLAYLTWRDGAPTVPGAAAAGGRECSGSRSALAAGAGHRTWIAVDYRSELYERTLGRVAAELGVVPVWQRRYEPAGRPGVLVLALALGPREDSGEAGSSRSCQPGP